MKKLVTLAVAGLMVAGGALVSAPAASAYPANSAPAVAIVGSNTRAPGQLSSAVASNFKPGCSATIVFTRARRNTVLAERTRVVQADGKATFGFYAPPLVGRFIAKVTQVKTANCAGFSAKTRFRVAR